MKVNRCLTFVFLAVSLCASSQNKVCQGSSENQLEDLNVVGKCAIEDFKKSNTREFVKVSTRNRYVRKRNNSHLVNFKKNLSTKNNITTQATKQVAKPAVFKKVTVTTKTAKAVVTEKSVKDYVRFDQVNDIPVFISCAKAASYDKRGCVKETFVNNILDNFTYPFDAAAAGIEGTVWVRFIIDKEGYVKNIATSGPINGKLLEEEAERLVELLPKFVPGRHNNAYVNVEYFLPIDFQLDE